jgi:hypothetical protein
VPYKTKLINISQPSGPTGIQMQQIFVCHMGNNTVLRILILEKKIKVTLPRLDSCLGWECLGLLGST